MTRAKWWVLVAIGAVVAAVIAVRLTRKQATVRLLVHADARATDAEETERSALVPFETALAGAKGVVRLEGLAESDGATVRATFAPGVTQDEARASVAAALRGTPASVTVAPASAPLHVTLTSDVVPLEELRAAFDAAVRPRLARAPGVAAVGACGGARSRVLVEIDPSRARAMRLDWRRAIDAIGAAPSIEALPGVTVDEKGGVPVRLRDVAVVSTTEASPLCVAWHGERQVVAALVSLAPDADEPRAIAAIASALDESARELPAGVRVQPLDFDAHARLPSLRLRVTGPLLPQEAALREASGIARMLAKDGDGLDAITMVGRALPGVEPSPDVTIATRVARPGPLSNAADFIRGLLDRYAALRPEATGADPTLTPHLVRVLADDPARASACAGDLAAALRELQWVRGVSVAGEGRRAATRVAVDGAAADRYGVDPGALALVEELLTGKDLTVGGREVVVRARAPNAQENVIPWPGEGVSVPTRSGADVPLTQLMRVETAPAFASIAHEGRRRFVAVRVEIPSTSWDGFVRAARPAVDAKSPATCAGLDVSWDGDAP